MRKAVGMAIGAFFAVVVGIWLLMGFIAADGTLSDDDYAVLAQELVTCSICQVPQDEAGQ